MAETVDMNRDEQFAQLDETWLGPSPSRRRAWSWLDWKFNQWVLRKCVGDAPVPVRWIFLRCDGCGKLRSVRRRSLYGECKCGSRRSTNSIGTVTTWRALWTLIRGY